MNQRWFSGILGSITVALTLTVGHGGKALAQNDIQADPGWIKICQKDEANSRELCIVNRQVMAETGQLIVGVQFRQVVGEEKIQLVAHVPTSMLIQPGVAIRVDDQTPKVIQYRICFPNGCFADAEVDAAFISALKKGGQLNILTKFQNGKDAGFPVSLAGFTKAWDGPGVDPQAAKQVSNELNEALQKRVQEMNQRIIEEQRKATGN